MMSDYKIYKIRQSSGKVRTIEEPVSNLKAIQKSLIEQFKAFRFHPSCMAVKGSSVAENAKQHEGANHILKIDIKDCYSCITREMIEFSLLCYEFEDLDLLDYCLVDKNNNEVLPTGAPTSPILCNIALTPLDYAVANLLHVYFGEKYRYTRYLDDLIISTQDKKRDWNLIHDMKTLIYQQGLTPNHRKCKWLSKGNDGMVVTGVQIDNRVGVQRNVWRQVRGRLNKLAWDQQPIDKHLQGKLAWINSVDPERYIKLINYYERQKQRANEAEQISRR